MGKESNRIDRLLNSSVPNAPQSEEEIRERLAALSRMRQNTEDDRPLEETSADTPEEPPVDELVRDTDAQTSSAARSALRGTPGVTPAPADPRQGLWELDRLLQYAIELEKMIQEIDEAPPNRSEATDRSGTVRVVLGADGLPEAFRVATDWNRRIDPESVGGAVVEACGAAVEKRLTAWGKLLEDQGLTEKMERIDRLEAEAGVASPNLPDDSLPAAFRRRPGDFQPPLGMLVENALSAQDALDSLMATSAKNPVRKPEGTGATKARTVRIAVSESGSVTCEVDPGWAARQTASRLADALNTALGAAREDLATGMAAARSSAADIDATRLNEVIMEAGAVIFDRRRTR